MLKVTADLFFPYTSGRKAGQVNTHSSVSVTVYGETPAKAMQKCADENRDIPTYKITKVEKVAA